MNFKMQPSLAKIKFFVLFKFLLFQNAYSLHFIAYGDTRTGFDMHQIVVDAIAKQNPDLVLSTGDLWDGYGPEKYKSIITKNTNLEKLLNQNLFLVSRGNHETLAEMLAFKPTLVRDSSELYAFLKNNCFFISLAMDPSKSTEFLEKTLKSEKAKSAKWKFVYSHFPVYSSGTHASPGIPTVETLCDKYGVTIFISGHDHNYQRTHQIYGGKNVDTTSSLMAKNGTVYVVTGGGGAPLYPVVPATFSHSAESINHYTDISTDDTKLIVRAVTAAGIVIDSFVIRM